MTIYMGILLLGCERRKESSNKPNVVIIMTDDQGYGDMSCHGNSFLSTPNLDELYHESVRFTDFHVDPTCSPTRAALMTGRYSTRAGVWLTYMGRHYLRQGEVTMADMFSSNGYRTGIFGKWHLGDNYPYRPGDRGFQSSLVHGGGVVGEAPDYWGNDGYDDTYLRNGSYEKTEGYCTDVWFREALSFIKEERERPFFVYIPTNAPHGPHNVPEKYVAPFRDRAGITESRAMFYGMISNIDENLGDFTRALAADNLLENTIFIFLTDNGTAGGFGSTVRKQEDGMTQVIYSGFNAGMRGKKGSPYEGGHRAACFIRWPEGGIRGGRNVDHLSAHMDVLPTLAALCKLDIPENHSFDGLDLSPLLQRKDNDSWPDRTLFVHHQGRFGQTVEFDGPVKYKDYAVMTEKWRRVGDMLFNIRDDPGQKVDLAGAYPGVMKDFGSAYEAWWKEVTERSDEYTRTIVGSPHQGLIMLTSQGWHGTEVPYNQQHIRNAMVANGFWDLEVEQAGTYRVELRRWPRELDAALDASIPPPILERGKHDLNYRLYKLPGNSIHVESARLKLCDVDRWVDVEPGQKMVQFEVALEKGKAELQTWFKDEEGVERGAYFVYLELID